MRSWLVTSPLILGIAYLAGCTQEIPVDRNEAPLASTNDDVTQAANLPVLLDARASYDADGDEMTFHWLIAHAPADSQLATRANPFIPNNGPDAATSRFQPDVQGVYVVELRVGDGEVYSDPTYIIVTATEPSDKPKANAGNDQFLAFGQTATLDGGQSQDPMGGILQYKWTIVEKPYNSNLGVNEITDADQRTAALTPDAPGKYTVGLVVKNGMANSDPDSAIVEFMGDNTAPTANAGNGVSVQDCTNVALDCSASTDPDGDRLYYWWTIQGAPGTSGVDNRAFTSQNSATTSLFLDVAGDYQVSCSVFDGLAWSRPATVKITASERTANKVPVVNLGPDLVYDGGEVECDTKTSSSWPYSTYTECERCPSSTLNVTAKVTDPDNDPFTVEWEVVRDTKVRLVGSTTGMSSIIQTPALQPDKTGVLEDVSYVELRATDCTGGIGKDDLEVSTLCTGVK